MKLVSRENGPVTRYSKFKHDLWFKVDHHLAATLVFSDTLPFDADEVRVTEEGRAKDFFPYITDDSFHAALHHVKERAVREFLRSGTYKKEMLSYFKYLTKQGRATKRIKEQLKFKSKTLVKKYHG